MNPEAARCLLCRNALCSASCPVKTDVPSAMKLYREGRISEAGKLLFENNPLSAITSRVCDWPRMCYGHCILNAKKVPVKWYEIEQEISTEYLLNEVKLTSLSQSAGKKVAVVGAGPAGICAALWLAQKGVAVDMYDSFPRIGGVLRYGIPDFRLDKTLVDAYEKILTGLGVAFYGNKTLGKNISLKELKATHDAVLVAAGAWIAREMRIPGEDNPHVIHALDFLTEADKAILGKKVLVIGGGNVAMDACRTAVRMGCDTTVVYRKTFENMPAGSIEVKEAMEEGVKFDVFKVPVEVRTEGERTYAIVRDCENYTREDGSLATRILEGTDTELDFDTMIVAVSESADKSLVEDAPKGVFCAGDYAYGPKTVVAAVQSAKEVTADILSYIGL